jgi:glycerol-3-phosphate O-acyltransferase
MEEGLKHISQCFTTRKDQFKNIRYSPAKSYDELLLLGYYKNGLVHVFVNEAFVSCSLYAFGLREATQTGVDVDLVFEKTLLLTSILRMEFVLEQ